MAFLNFCPQQTIGNYSFHFAAVNRLIFGADNLTNLTIFNVTKNARCYFDEFYAWNVVLSDEEVWSWYSMQFNS